MADEWYRRTTWTESDREAFEAKLKRSRQKSQFLRIQASHLAEAHLWDAAIELLTRSVAEFPQDDQMAQVQLQLAEAYVQIGKREMALRAFDLSVAAQRAKPNFRTQVWLLYPWYVVEQQFSALYDMAGKLLDEFANETNLSLPIERYRYNACRALLAEHGGKPDAAKRYAASAIAAASETHSGFRYHPEVGLVDSTAGNVHDRLVSLQAKKPT